MSAEMLALIAGSLLSLLFSYVPGLNVWFAGLESTYKRLIMVALLLLVSVSVFAISCTTWGAAWGIEVTCDQPGAQIVITSFLLAVMANQGAYGLSPETPGVREAKAAR